ncbi:hypothetical protein V9K67_17610 [Paraflavisolibacter sp. H34]|uniref:hypothetical protein n=1 Tax=Huijunlia imazamoxiresistens TaxID=3127457 RepID=UPI0030195FA8
MPIRTLAVETVEYLDTHNLSLKEMLANVSLSESEFIQLLEGCDVLPPDKKKKVEWSLFPGKKVCTSCGLVFPLSPDARVKGRGPAGRRKLARQR